VQVVSVHQLVDRLDVEYRALCIEKGRRWECHSEHALARTDPVLLERILRNLLDNAIKHGGQGAVRLAVEVVTGVAVLLTVSDNGPGISENEQEYVFDEFYRGAESLETGGMGLGLAIVKRLASALDGRLRVAFTDPQARSGASFSLELPASGMHAAHGAEEGQADRPPPDVEGLKILVVDDELTVLTATRAVLVQWGCDVQVCRTSRELALVGASSWRPDVALVDYRFEPSTTGLDALVPLCANHPAMGVVVITGESDAKVLARLAESGLPVLGKPADPDELRLTLSLFKSVT
jgi:CheY-like chemotaxis protein/anti-sigma regulatory factor (Ser/Thr protein kinase)